MPDWPAELPAQEYFVAAYHADEVNQRYQTEAEYLGWIRSFYQGSLIAPTGWLEMQALVISTAPFDERRRLSTRLEELGVAIAAEWAKENDERVIDSRMLSLWGSVLQLAADPQQQQHAIDVIAADVNGLLAGELQGELIEDGRYERLLNMELFGGF